MITGAAADSAMRYAAAPDLKKAMISVIYTFELFFLL